MAHIKKRENKNATTYVVCWRDPGDGGFREKSFRLRKDANTYKSTIEADIARGHYVDDKASRLTFATVAEEWLQSVDTSKRMDAERRRILTGRIEPTFGRRKIGAITATDCAAFKNKLKAEGLRPATIRNVFAIVRSVLNYAVKARYIPANPAALVTMPTEKSMNLTKSQPRYLTPYQLEELIDAAALFHPDYGLLVRFLAMTGLRVGECAALNVGDVRIWNGKGQVQVSKTYDARHGLSNSPKTSRSNRVVELLPTLVPPLEEYLSRHPRRADPSAPLWMGRTPGGIYTSDNPKPSDSKHFGPIDGTRSFDPDKRWDPMSFTKHVWRRSVRMARLDRASSVGLTEPEPRLTPDTGEPKRDADYPPSGRLKRDPSDPRLPLRMHDLRHTAASLMLTAGVPLIVVSRQLGHSSVATTDKIYGGLQRSAVESEMVRLDEWLREQQAATERKVIPLR